jgi:methylenetetrahydrofolate dehydrogenase (NADP+)/methenyltetrahydrofolate cyclohydrolase
MMPGAPVADAVLEDVRARTDVLVAAGHVPGLATLLVGDDPASAGYIRMKQEKAAELGFASPHVHLPSTATQADVLAVISDFNADAGVDAMLFQHPAPRHFDYDAALATVDPDKDVDGMQPVNVGRLALGLPAPVACTPAGIEALLAHYEIPVAGQDVCIVGRGATIGRPLALLLSQKRDTANAAVTVVHYGSVTPGSVAERAPHAVAAFRSPAEVSRATGEPARSHACLTTAAAAPGTPRRRGARCRPCGAVPNGPS